MLPKEHLSVSQINMYLRCPVSYYYRYVEGLIIPPKVALTRGKVVHSGIEYNYGQKMETKKDLPLTEVQEYTSAAFEEESEDTDFGEEDKGKVKDSAINLVTLYHKEVAPTVQPKAVEEKFEIGFVDTDYTLLGFVDLIDQNDVIRDTKSTGRTPSERVLVDNLQLAAYSLMYQEVTGKKEQGVGFDYLVNLKTPKVVSFRTTIDDVQRARFLRIMDSVAKAIKNEVYMPRTEQHGNYLCSVEQCGYWEKCHKEW